MSKKFTEVTSAIRKFSTYSEEEFIEYLTDELNISKKMGGSGVTIKSLYKEELIKNEDENLLYQFSEYVLRNRLLLEFGGYAIREHMPIGLYRTVDIYII